MDMIEEPLIEPSWSVNITCKQCGLKIDVMYKNVQILKSIATNNYYVVCACGYKNFILIIPNNIKAKIKKNNNVVYSKNVTQVFENMEKSVVKLFCTNCGERYERPIAAIKKYNIKIRYPFDDSRKQYYASLRCSECYFCFKKVFAKPEEKAYINRLE